MAIYHFSAKVIGRAAGSSAVAAAAYRSGSRLPDQRLGRDHDFSSKRDVVHSEILLPDGAQGQLSDRATLWNAVESAEVRRDAQLAREIEFAIPRELTQQQGVALAREFVQREFVDRGMVADLNVHWDRGADGRLNPHAHVMLTMREVGEDGRGSPGAFGRKVRDWNRTGLLREWREGWADHVNQRLTELEIDARVDHRSLQAQGIALEPQHKIGAAALRRLERGEEAERVADHRRIDRENGARIIAEPKIAIDALTRQQATFTGRDVAKFVHAHSDGGDQFNRAIGAIQSSPELVWLGTDERGRKRFTSREMVAVERRLERAAVEMARSRGHDVAERRRELALDAAAGRGLTLSGEQREALEHVTGKEGLAAVVGYAGSGKSAMLGAAREAWEAEGYTVRGAALSGIAAENLEAGSGLASRTLASLEHQWERGRDQLTARDVLVIDEAGMVGSRQMERVLSHARDAGAKVVLVGDPEQLQAIEAGAAFRSIAERLGAVEITEVRRQREDWQREATRQLATGHTDQALDAYQSHGDVHAAETREQARRELVDGWDRARRVDPDRSRIILTHTNAEVRDLNALARGRLRDAGELGEEVAIATERGERAFAPGDRLMFLRNERSLGVKNGTLGTVLDVGPDRLTVRTDDRREVGFDVKDYADVDHGYAATIHKAQGVTVDQAHVLATPGLDRHGAYVALSRHRDRVSLHYGRDDFTDGEALARKLSRERSKDMAGDYGRDFAERRGIDAPARSPERSRQEPAREPDVAVTRERAVLRHARVVSLIFQAQEDGLPVLAEQNDKLHHARQVLNRFDPHASRDIERAYKADPPLAHEAATGRITRAIRAMQLQAELRLDPAVRADRFVQRWRKLDAQMTSFYQTGDMADMRRVRDQMGAMAKSLERDPQLDSLLAIRKQQLGIDVEMGRSLARTLAFNIGYDWGRGRGLGL